MIAGAAKAGLSLVSAVRQVGAELPPPLSQEFQLMQHEQRLGVTLDDSLENLTHRIPVQSVSLMVSAIRIAFETGGGLAETLECTAATLRSQRAMELKIRALASQGKLQAWRPWPSWNSSESGSSAASSPSTYEAVSMSPMNPDTPLACHAGFRRDDTVLSYG
jgi:hypothetical protein